MPRRRYVSPPTDWFPPAQRTIVYTLQGLGLEIHPWIYMMGRDLHAWVTLNGLKPLTFVVPKLCNREAGRRQENGTLDWEWSINADYEDGSHPWRGYIPLHNDWVKWGTQGWLFERQIPTSVLITAGTPARLHICKARKKNIELTYRAIDFICLNVSRMYELDIPFRLHPPPVQWVNEEYPDQASICARIWDARRSILELYGWVSYQLLHDLSPWRERIWKPAFRDLLNRLDFLSASRRGVIIDPSSASEDQIIKLVRDEVPIHYQWIPRGYIVHDPVIYTALAARFDPYDFEITRDYAAYRQAGGPYSIQSMDHSKLNSNGTAELSAAYARGKNRLFQLPAPKEVSGNVKKKKMRCFAYDSDEGEYVEVSKAAMDRLVHFETGKVITKYHDSGDMMVFTFLEPPTPSLETSKLHNFFERLEPEEQVTESVFIQLQPAQPPHPAMGQEIGNAHAEVPSCPPDHDHDVPMEPVVQSPPAQSSQPVAELSFEAMVIDDRSLLDVDSPIDQGIGENVIITQLDGPPCPPGRDHDHPMDLIDPIVQSQPLQPAVRQMSHEVALIDQPRVDEQPRSPDQANEDPVELTLQPPSTQPPQPAVEQPFDTTNVVDQPLPVEPSRPSIQDYDSDSNSTISLGESTTMSWDNFVGEATLPEAESGSMAPAVNPPPPEAPATTAHDQPSPVAQMAPSRNSPLRPPPLGGSPHRSPPGGLLAPYAQDINRRTLPSPPSLPPESLPASYRDIDRRRSPSPHRWSSSHHPPERLRPPYKQHIKPQWLSNTSSRSSHRVSSSREMPERGRTQPVHRYTPYPGQPYPSRPSSRGSQAQAISIGEHTLGFHPSGSHLSPTGTSLEPPDARRNAAIQLVLSFFASSATNTIFSGPDVPITDPLPLAVPAHIREYGRLKVPANTELRLRYWHLLDTTASVDNLLGRCLMKGLPYRVCTPSVPSLPTHSFFRGHALVVDTANLLKQGQTKSVAATTVQSYFDNVQKLLRQPDAHKFLECGGLISRIARHYAPGLLALAFNGPPLDWQDTELDAGGTHRALRVRQAEIQTLLGLTTNSSSLWPSPDLYENSDKYNGEWTQANEAWFSKHAANIQGCMQGCLRSGRDWQRAVRGHTVQQIASPTTIGTVAHARASCDKLTFKYPEFWSAFDHMSFAFYSP